jgi:hypothetical protein
MENETAPCGVCRLSTKLAKIEKASTAISDPKTNNSIKNKILSRKKPKALPWAPSRNHLRIFNFSPDLSEINIKIPHINRTSEYNNGAKPSAIFPTVTRGTFNDPIIPNSAIIQINNANIL